MHSSIAVGLGMVALAGCVHQRLSMLVDVDDYGPQIETKNRYAIRNNGAIDWEVQEYLSRLNRNLQKAQPNVFSPDGIPFTIKTSNFKSSRDNLWTGAFAILMIPPVMGSGGEASYRQTIDVLDNPDAHGTFTVKFKNDTAFAMLSPLPLLCYPGVANFDEEPDACCKYACHKISLLGGDTVMEYGDTIDDFGSGTRGSGFNSVVAYGIAAVLKRMEDEGKIDLSRSVTRQKHIQMTDSPVSADFDLVAFHRDDKSGYSYSFVFKSRSGNITLRASRKMQEELREMIRDDFVASFPAANRAVLVVDFAQFSVSNGELKGSASILPLDVLSFSYDGDTRKGMMKIRVETLLMEEARNYCRKQIELVVRDKNIAHHTGQLPPEARYYLLSEAVRDGILEIEFKSE